MSPQVSMLSKLRKAAKNIPVYTTYRVKLWITSLYPTFGKSATGKCGVSALHKLSTVLRFLIAKLEYIYVGVGLI